MFNKTELFSVTLYFDGPFWTFCWLCNYRSTNSH